MLSTHPHTDLKERDAVKFIRSSHEYIDARSRLHEVADEVSLMNQSSKLLSKLISMNHPVTGEEKQYTFPVSSTSSSILIHGESGTGKRSLCYELYPKFSLVRQLKAQELLVNGYEDACKVILI